MLGSLSIAAGMIMTTVGKTSNAEAADATHNAISMSTSLPRPGSCPSRSSAVMLDLEVQDNQLKSRELSDVGFNKVEKSELAACPETVPASIYVAIQATDDAHR